MQSYRRSTRNTTYTSETKPASGISTSRNSTRSALASVSTGREPKPARSTTKNSQEHVSGIPGIRVPTPAPACSRQDAQGQACSRIGRPLSHSAVAVQSKDIAHATESRGVVVLSGGLVALAPQTRPRPCHRLYRLVVDALPDCRCAFELPAYDRSLRHRQPVRRICEALRHGSAGGNQENASRNPRRLQDRLVGRAVHDAGSDALA